MLNSVYLASLAGVEIYLMATASQIQRWRWHELPWLRIIETSDRLKTARGRFLFERRELQDCVRRYKINMVFNLNGISPALGLSNVTECMLAQNPYPFVKNLPRQGILDTIISQFKKREFSRTQKGKCLKFYNSRYMKESYELIAGCTDPGSEVLYQGVYRAGASAAVTQAPLNFAQREKAVLFVSSITPHKRLEDLLQAFQLVMASEPDAQLRIVSGAAEGHYLNSLKQMAVHLGVSRNTQFLGYLSADELAEAYLTSRVYCSLSRCKSFGIPAIEAQLQGTPAVVADCCAPPEVIGDGGVKVPVGDHQGTARALIEFLCHEEGWNEFSARALANAHKYEWTRCSAPLVASIAAEARK